MIDVETLNKAIILTQKGLVLEAEALYLKLLEQDPSNYILLSTLGLFYVNVHDFEKASIYLEKACTFKETLGTVSALGFCEYEKGDFEKSAEILERALILGESVDVYNKLCLSLFQIKSYQKAIKYSVKMYEKYPKEQEAVSNIVKAYTQCGKLLEAEKICVEYLRENHNSSGLWFHLGYLKELIYRDDVQACECYKMALEQGNKLAYYNIAVSYQKQRNFKLAEENYLKMLELFPNDNDTITSLGMCYLTQKKFKEGYDLFFQRSKTHLDDRSENPYSFPTNIDDEVVVICDQGFGDHVHFARYLPILRNKVKKLYVAEHTSLIPLMQKNFPDIEFITYDEINPKMQSMRITDLAYILGIDFDNIPSSAGYLDSECAEIDSEKLKVGVCWEAGSAGIRTMINRTINVKLFEPIFNIDNIQLYSFQVRDTFKGNEKYPQLINLAKDFQTFEDTAKALKSMDVVVTVDTVIAHLAGALGVKTYLLLPYATDWRWFDDNKNTPWYDCVEIFKQNDPMSWDEPIEKIVNLLKNSN